ncbi:cytochrome P450 [Oricola sp.]|uniref:cytochrome P450 n=1 Tax=Oricola sp. TaxID=1979950 RepID=UPI0025EDFF0D|nr:cytochrome P450 [Oricola sp.]MCI5078105.1 cytochrome P450 [Oricola sp.]
MIKIADNRPQPKDPGRFSKAHEFDAETETDFDDAHRLFDDLRARCPVAHSNDLDGFWLLTRYKDIADSMSDFSLFSTAVQNVVPRVATAGRRPPLHLDPPEHTPYRRAIAPLFRRERIDYWRPIVRKMAEDLFAPLVPTGEADICIDFSYHLPIHVLAEFFMIPAQKAAEIREMGQAFNHALQTKDFEGLKKTSLFLYEMAQEIIDDRKLNPRDPGEDPTSALLAARNEGEPLPEDMILGTIRQLLVVGIIAPTTLLGSVAVHFCRHPDDFTLIKEHPERVADATEELMRLYTPYRGFARTPTRDVEIGGRLICEDEPIALSFAAANRDPEVYSDPATFKLDREGEPPHIAFGRGAHQCIGAPLARLMLTAAVAVFTEKVNGFELAGPTPMTTWPEYGPYSVPVRFL